MALLSVGLAAPVHAQVVFIKHLWVHWPDEDRSDGDQSNCVFSIQRPGQISCGVTSGGSKVYSIEPAIGNISNNPHIEFERTIDATCSATANSLTASLGISNKNICNTTLYLCAKIGWSNQQSNNSTFALDTVKFEVFKFSQGSNPLDPASTPPLRTFFVDDPGIIAGGTTSDNAAQDALLPPVCVLWDGSINIQGEFGKSNGQFGFRGTVATNQTNPTSGNINIEQTRAYPSGAAKDANGLFVEQKPITIDVVNVHAVRSSPTVVGELTGVAAEPYSLVYRLSKDALTTINIQQATQGLSPTTQVVRRLVPLLPRAGEGVPSGSLQNGDSWNGRHDNGGLMLPGVYIAALNAETQDQFGYDTSDTATRQISVDPLQITDIRVQPLQDQATSLAVISYVLTEPAKVHLDIYPPGTQFSGVTNNPPGCNSANNNSLNNINNPCQDLDPNGSVGGVPNNGAPKNFGAQLNGSRVAPIRHIEEQQDFRRSVITFWDGRDSDGQVVDDGDYVFVLYAEMPSPNGLAFGCTTNPTLLSTLPNCSNDKRIWSSNAKSGFITVSRGLVTISQIGPSSTVIGSSPPVAGLDPFTFSYSLSRDASISMRILKSGDATATSSAAFTSVVRNLIVNEQRPGNFLNRERWATAVDDLGLYVSSGNYLVELTAKDAFFPRKVSTTTALFPVNLFRMTDVFTTPLLTGATDVVTLTYQLSQPMQVVWSIYPPGTTINTGGQWPPCGQLEPAACGQVTNNGVPATPIITVKGMRPGRLRITEFWDGRDINGLFVPDGNYVYTVVARSTTTPQYFASDQVFGTLTVARGSIVFPIFSVTPTIPALFNSSQTVSLPPYEIDYSLTRQSSVTVQILTTAQSPQVVRTLVAGQVRDPNIINREFWDARDDRGSFVSPGFYLVRAVAEDLASQLSSGSTAQQTISVNPLRIYDVAVSALRADQGTALLAYQVSETMKVSVKIYRPGTIFGPGGVAIPPDSTSLVKRIVGVRPPRTEVTESWDGTDEKNSIVPDGNYIFRIFASTETAAIDTVSGNARPGANLAEDIIIADIPVTRGGTLDPQADFSKNSFVYPNPLDGPTATFQVYVPLQSNVSLRIYNIAGDLVLDKNFGNQAADSYVTYNWAKTNQSGKAVAHGVYFLLIRAEPTRGEKTPMQVVKKLLIK